jgi:hypothetical protein
MCLLNILKKLCCCLKKNEEDLYDDASMTTNPINPQNFEAHQIYPYKKSFN